MAALQSDFDLQAPQEQTSEALTEFDLKLGELSSEQAGLTGETEEEERQLEAEQRAALEAQLREAMGRARELAAQLEAVAGSVETAPLHSTDREALQRLRSRAKEAREAVESLSHELARDEATRLQGGAEALGEEVRESEARTSEPRRREQLQEVIEGLGTMRALAGELREELDKVAPKAPRPSGERRKGANRLSKRQERLERAVTELEQHLEGVDATLPGLGESLQPAMKAAKKAMRSASEELGEVRPGDATGHQRRAMEQLGAMKKAIDKRLQDASGRGGGGGGIHRRDQRVEIPEAEEHGAPKALRDALLKAMKERAPERYEEAIERYYKELVR
jgi:chromosome segregation ATPase